MSGLRQHQAAATFFIVHRPHDEEELKGQGTMMQIAPSTATRCGYRAVFLILAIASALTPAVAQDFPPDVTRGKAVYARHCLACHGAGGWGDGPDAAALRVPPMNFHRFTSVLKSDEELLRTIEHGVVFSPMHAWQGILTETERQDALAYIRLLVQQGR
jgi:mono/diheme cytochrome c family protein